MRARMLWLGVLLLAVASLFGWRIACVLAGPDIDTDAYAHHMIARAIVDDPRDLGVHWVWLPLFHYAQVPLVLAGGSMEVVRWANSVLTAALPVVLFGYLSRTSGPSRGALPGPAIALLAALLAGACPIGMQMGTTAQPEPLFALLVLGVAITVQRRRYPAAAAMLGAAVLLRYEAWAVLFALAARFGFELWAGRNDRSAARADLRRSWIVLGAPLLLIVSWAALRRPVDGQWFGFLRQTHEFASGALHEQTALDRGPGALARDLLYYPIVVAARVLGPALALVPFGVARTVREQGSRFVLVFAACLGFISLSWAMRSSLGLDRHFVVVVPLYATCAAQGVAAAADFAVRRASRWGAGDRAALRTGRGIALGLATSAVLALGVELVVWMGFWRASIARGWPERTALGAYLRSLPASSTVFCDDATLEILSGLDRRRFDRHWVDDPQTWDRVGQAAREQGTVYVATWRRKLRSREQSGEIVFAAGFNPDDRDGTGVAVMRVTADGGRSQR
jgi:hypothetical protein